MRVPPARFSALVFALAALLGASCAHLPTPKEQELAENYYDQGVLAMKGDRPQEALQHFQDAVGEDPALPQPHNALGLLYWWSYAEAPKAKAQFELALKLDPHYAEAANNLGTFLTELKDYAGAQKAYNQALAQPLYKTPFVAQVNLGWLFHLEGHDAQAERTIRSALTAEPGYCVGHRQLARLLEATGRTKEATEQWNRFVALCPNSPEALLHGAKIEAAKGDAVGAARDLEKCLAKAGGQPVARECRQALSRLPPLPPGSLTPPPSPPANGELGKAQDLGAVTP